MAQLPVGRFLVVSKAENKRLRERSTVSIFSLEDDRFEVFGADEGHLLNQFGVVVVDVQQPHMERLL